MSIDQQIKQCEERILRLEEYRRNAGGDPGQISARLDEQYTQIALLKIRKMMGY